MLRKEMETSDESISIEIWLEARLVALRDSGGFHFLITATTRHCRKSRYLITISLVLR